MQRDAWLAMPAMHMSCSNHFRPDRLFWNGFVNFRTSIIYLINNVWLSSLLGNHSGPTHSDVSGALPRSVLRIELSEVPACVVCRRRY